MAGIKAISDKPFKPTKSVVECDGANAIGCAKLPNMESNMVNTSGQANMGTSSTHMKGHSLTNKASYAAITAILPPRYDSKFNAGISGNITWASKHIEGRQLDRGLALRKFDVDNSTGVILNEEDVYSTEVVWYATCH
jgi:hypothetical protein